MERRFLKRNLVFLVLYMLPFLLLGQVQSPSEFFHREYGSFMPLYDDVVEYFDYISETSQSVIKVPYGRSYEGRELAIYIFGTEESLNEVDHIKKRHREYLEAKAQEDVLIIWYSYGVHGNEIGATVSASIVAYNILKNADKILDDCIVIIDPSVNPDGFARYTQWYNQVKSQPHQIQPDAYEHVEPWPSGRVNHYLFDLNRDMIWATQQESRDRIVMYQEWLPHIHVDFHEQFPENPYYFAPAAEPIHEQITSWQKEFQEIVGKNNAREFDENGWLYFTKEYFDLYYPGYGDTYPMFHGAIGMTYEQAGHGVAGLGVQLKNGQILTLLDRINHHASTSMTTLETAIVQRDELIRNMQKFYRRRKGKGETIDNYVMTGMGSAESTYVKNFLDLHNITYLETRSNSSVEGYRFFTRKREKYNLNGISIIISRNQFNRVLIDVLFQVETHLSTPITYDITAWAIPFSWGIETFGISGQVGKTSQDSTQFSRIDLARRATMSQTIAILLPHTGLESMRILASLIQDEIPVRIARMHSLYSDVEVKVGDFLIMKGDVGKNWDRFFDENGVLHNEYKGITLGLATSGVDLGSDKYELIEKPKIMTLFDHNVDTNSAGFLWHFMEQDLCYPLSRVKKEHFATQLKKHNVFILMPGHFQWTQQEMDDIFSWVSHGGKLILVGNSCISFANKKETALTLLQQESRADRDSLIGAEEVLRYDEKVKEDSTTHNPGGVIRTKIDNSHPLAYGFGEYYFTLKEGKKSYALSAKLHNVSYVEEKPMCYGFIGSTLIEQFKSSLVIGVEEKDSGSIVYFTDDPLYRGFWRSGKFLMSNAIFNF